MHLKINKRVLIFFQRKIAGLLQSTRKIKFVSRGTFAKMEGYKASCKWKLSRDSGLAVSKAHIPVFHDRPLSLAICKGVLPARFLISNVCGPLSISSQRSSTSASSWKSGMIEAHRCIGRFPFESFTVSWNENKSKALLRSDSGHRVPARTIAWRSGTEVKWTPSKWHSLEE